MLDRSAETLPRLAVMPLQPEIGAEVTGIDLSHGLNDDEQTLLRQALLDHGVIFLRRQPIDEARFIALAEVFGTVSERDEVTGKPRLGHLKVSGGAKDQSANIWHSDGCYLPAPPILTMLQAVKASPLGGDTCFSSAVAAYEGLGDVMKERIAGLRYRSSFSFIVSRFPRFSDPRTFRSEPPAIPRSSSRSYGSIPRPGLRCFMSTTARRSTSSASRRRKVPPCCAI